jgi:antitoxin component YwqK of YwqJK toxin-antitoxin module
MKNLLLTLTFILLLLSLMSCNEQKIYKEYYAEGSLKCEAEVVGNTKNGFYREYYPSGKFKFKGQYI